MAQNKFFNKIVELEEVSAAVVTIYISIDLFVCKGDEPRPALEVYKDNWLKLSNHKRETYEILAVDNFGGSNLVDVVLNIEDSSMEKAVEFCSQLLSARKKLKERKQRLEETERMFEQKVTHYKNLNRK